MSKVQYGVQLYSLRDTTKEDMCGTLKAVAEMGYKYVEFASFFDYTAEQLKSWLDEFSLLCGGVHTNMNVIATDEIDNLIHYCKVLECNTVVVPSCDWSTKEKTKETIDIFNAANEKLSKQSIALGYHNHSREFFANANGIVFMEELLARTSLHLEIDTFWLYNADIDPVSYLDAHKDRIKVIHLKDGVPSPKENKNFNAVQTGVMGRWLGLGTAPIKEICSWCIENDVLMIVESEDLNPSGKTEVKGCIEFLKTLDL